MAFDVQGGGSDLAYPHHEMCASIGHVASGSWPFARHYVHAAMVGLDGEKMSKSRGNLVFVSRLLADGVPGDVIRLALLAHHYRTDWTWSDADLAEAAQRHQSWAAAVAAEQAPPAGAVLDEVRRRIADDLDAPGALQVLDRWAAQVRRHEGRDTQAPGAVADLVDALLGVRLR
jgi:L-cysteine:1D-myo-inositol 2-amino-2-deoxy-alpha-D-glucopyranoside ligase